MPFITGPAVALALVACVGLAVHASRAIFDWGGSGAETAVEDWLYLALFGVVVLSLGLRARRDRPARLPWTLATVGVAVWGAAELSYRIVEPDDGAAYPTITRLMLLLAFALAAVTLVLLARRRVRHVDRGLLLDGAIGGLAVASVAAAFLFAEGDTGANGGPPALFLVADLGILAFVVASLGLTGWRPGACWGLIVSGIVLNTAGNAVLVAERAAGEYARGSLADTLFMASALALGVASWIPLSRRSARLRDNRTLVWPAVLAAGALLLLLVGALVDIAPLAAGLAASTGALLVWRTVLAFAENRRLLERSRREALTDALTGLGNRRALTDDLAAAAEGAEPGRPVTFATFDLDGFKAYNDTFGHPAGDALLERMAARLERVAAGATGGGAPARAYRAGGDEFCLLIRQSRNAAALTLRAAARALSERGEGFDITCSLGAAELPEEARDPEQAMQVADHRMYEAKQRRRSSARHQTSDVLFQVLAESQPALGEHQARVGRLAVAVGRKLGMSASDLDVLARAAELHDIGKVAVPDEILSKPGPLDDDEWAFVRQHTVIGERILRAAPAMEPVATLVRSSHERWDGSGYPDGLAGTEIPLGARVIAVCDAFSAMTDHRPYGLPKTERQAVEELERCAGRQFDPAVVSAFALAWSDLAREDERDPHRRARIREIKVAVQRCRYEVDPHKVAEAIIGGARTRETDRASRPAARQRDRVGS